MEEHRLSFGRIRKHADDLAEIIIDEGIEVSAAMVDEYHAWIGIHLASPALILVDKRHQYSYTFEAQQQVSTGSQVSAIAVVTHNPVGMLTARYVTEMPRPYPLNARIFNDREQALAWLHAQRAPEPSGAT